MPSTTTKVNTLKEVLTRSLPGEVEDALRKVDIGAMLSPIKKTFTSLASSATHDITDAAHGSSSAAMGIFVLRVTAGAASAGLRQVGDAGATPSATVATLSDDGKTITFETTVTGFIVEYLARPATDTSSKFA